MIVPTWIDIKCPQLFIVVVIAMFLVSKKTIILRQQAARVVIKLPSLSRLVAFLALLIQKKISFELTNLHFGIAAGHAIAP